MVALRNQQLRIMECLDELSLGTKGQIIGEDIDHLPVASLATADQMASSLDVPLASFDALQETLVHLGLDVRWEQDPTLSEFTSYNQDHPLGGAVACYDAYIYTKVAHPDTMPFGCQAGLCSGFPPTFPCSQQLAP